MSAYIGQKNSSSVTQVSDEISPDGTPKAGLASPKATTNIISKSSGNVNSDSGTFNKKGLERNLFQNCFLNTMHR